MKTLFARDFILKPRERAWIVLKTVLGIFKIAFRLRDRHVFMWQSLGILNLFNTLTLKQFFWKTQIRYKKLKCRFFSWKYQDWKRNSSIQNSFRSQIVVQNRHIISYLERSFASNYFTFSEIFFQFKNLV